MYTMDECTICMTKLFLVMYKLLVFVFVFLIIPDQMSDVPNCGHFILPCICSVHESPWC